jgi:hypothetical protein
LAASSTESARINIVVCLSLRQAIGVNVGKVWFIDPKPASFAFIMNIYGKGDDVDVQCFWDTISQAASIV